MLKESGRWDQILADGLAGKYDAKPERDFQKFVGWSMCNTAGANFRL
jgi:hypothetical protein